METSEMQLDPALFAHGAPVEVPTIQESEEEPMEPAGRDNSPEFQPSEADFQPSEEDPMSEPSEEEFVKQPTPKGRKGKKQKIERDEDKEVKLSGGASNRCHQCRNPPTQGAEIIRCTDLRRYDATGKVLKTPRSCEAGFCSRCLLNRYDETIRPEARNDWSCPVCRLICNCARCRRKKGLQPTGQLLARAKELGVDSAQAALALSPMKPTPYSTHVQPEAGPSQVKKPLHPRERATRPDGVAITMPDDAPLLEECLHLREFVYRFKDLCYDLGPHARGSKAAQTALTELDDLVNVWSTETTSRLILRGLLRCLQRENSFFASPLHQLINPHRVEQALKETHTQSRWGDKCWRTARPLVDGEETGEKIIPPPEPEGQDGLLMPPALPIEDGNITPDESMEVDELEDSDQQPSLPTPTDKVRILNALAELAMKSEVVRADLQEGVEVAVAYRATMAKAKKDAGDTKAALKTELLEARTQFFGTEEMQDIEQRTADHDYDSRAGLAKLYVDSVSKRTRFRPLCTIEGIDYYLPSQFSPTIPLEADNLSLISCAVLAHRPEEGQKGWTVFRGAAKIRQLTDWLDSELKHQQYQSAKANAAAAAAAGEEGAEASTNGDSSMALPAAPTSEATLVPTSEAPGSELNGSLPAEPKKEPTAASQFADPTPQISLVDTIQPLRAFADFVEFKLEVEPPYRAKNREVHWRHRSAVSAKDAEVDELEE